LHTFAITRHFRHPLTIADAVLECLVLFSSKLMVTISQMSFHVGKIFLNGSTQVVVVCEANFQFCDSMSHPILYKRQAQEQPQMASEKA
jgi:hypothetical protein